jgi:SAM-dependent methyltransferase
LETYHWWFVGRRRLFIQLIKQLLQPEFSGAASPLWAVDMGCGTGVNLDALSQFGRVVGVDVSETALLFCRERKPYRICQAPASHLPFRSESIRLLTAFDVLEHCEDDRAVLNEAFRVCAPGGWAFITVPAYHFMWGEHDVVAEHYRRYSAREIRERIEESGFGIHRMTYINSFLFPITVIFRHVKALVVGLLRKLGWKLKLKSDFRSTAPRLLNPLFLKVFSSEIHVLRRTNFPFGLSICCIAQKPPLSGQRAKS